MVGVIGSDASPALARTARRLRPAGRARDVLCYHYITTDEARSGTRDRARHAGKPLDAERHTPHRRHLRRRRHRDHRLACPAGTRSSNSAPPASRTGAIVATFSELVRPGEPIPYSVQLLTGITDRMVAGAPRSRRSSRASETFADGAVLIAHNYRFDLGFLDYHAETATGRPFPRPVLDTLALAKQLHPDLGQVQPRRCSPRRTASRRRRRIARTPTRAPPPRSSSRMVPAAAPSRASRRSARRRGSAGWAASSRSRTSS